MRMSILTRVDIERVVQRLKEYGAPRPYRAIFTEALYEESKGELPPHEVTKREGNLVFIKLIG